MVGLVALCRRRRLLKILITILEDPIAKLIVGSCGLAHIFFCTRVVSHNDVRREDRFGWRSCSLPLPLFSQDQDDVRRFQDRFGWLSCPLLLPQSSSAFVV